MESLRDLRGGSEGVFDGVSEGVSKTVKLLDGMDRHSPTSLHT